MVRIKIDNQIIEAEPGSTILDAANKAFICIPTLCSHESLSAFGACRVCTVEISVNGKSGLTTACTYPAEEGLEVKTNSEKVKEARRLAVQLLLAQNPCSDRIQELARRLGIEKPGFTLKEDECILCGLCVRACRELVGAEAISFIDQGLDRDVDEACVEHSEIKCIGCDSCAYVCPTEAITVEDVGDTRTLTTPSRTIKFRLKKCKVCGRYWAPEKQIEYIAKQSNQPLVMFEVCPNCRE